MNGKQTVLKAMRNQSLPRPAWIPYVGVHGAQLLNVSASEYLCSSRLIADGLTRAAELYRPDGLPVVFDLQIEAESLGCELHWVDDGPPSVASHPMAEGIPSEMPSYDPAIGRLPVALEAVKLTREKLGDSVALLGLITGPFTLALHLRGSDIFLDMFDGEDEVRRLMDFCADVAATTADKYLEAGVDVVAVVDPMVSQIGPDHFGDLVVPALNKVFDRIHASGAPAALFVCGDTTRNIGEMVKSSCDCIAVDENVSLTALRQQAEPANKSIAGNMKLTLALLLGTPEDCQRDALRCFVEMGSKGAILAPGCDIPWGTPERNLQAVAEMVHQSFAVDLPEAMDEAEAGEDGPLPWESDGDNVRVDVVTLDSASCPPCGYMLEAARRAADAVGDVEVHEHKIRTPEGLAMMKRLKVTQIPSLCINGEVAFASIIPDLPHLRQALSERASGVAS